MGEVLHTVNKRSKSIRKNERQVSDSLKRRKINIEAENLEVIDIIQAACT